MRGRKIFESDANVLFRALADNYRHVEPPKLNICMFDIETDFDPKKGFSSPEDPYAPVNAVSLHLNWTGDLICLGVAPHTITKEQGQEICDSLPNTVLCKDEEELLRTFLDLIEDADVISGWNSTFFDIPYLVKRIELVLGSDYTRKLCYWNQKPKKKYITRFGREQLTYELFGKVHCDYLELFKKNAMQEHHSYKLDYIGETVVGEKKIPYNGSLYDLYHYDFKKFLEYNRQDSHILVKLEEKEAYIVLSLQMAHSNSVLIKTTLGTVAMCDQALLNEIHDRGMVAHDKIRHNVSEHEIAAGAYVADPVVGMHTEIGAIDINSLYPACIRSLNMCSETLLGQARDDATRLYLKEHIDKGMTATDAWHDTFGSIEYQAIIEQADADITFDFEDGTTETRNARDWYDYFFTKGLDITLSANGTIFRTDIDGVIPGILTKWYTERQEMQAKKKTFSSKARAAEDPVLKKELEHMVQYWDHRQYVRKIMLNSLYGALLNPNFRFYDPRVGQSVTLTGRCITKHMSAKTNQLIEGTYDYKGKACIYSDTDSVYFSAVPVLKDNPDFVDFDWSRDNVVALYDTIADEVNSSFKQFMISNFNCPPERAEIIAAGRELVASNGMFIKKKRYALLVYDDEGYRLDKDPAYKETDGKIKAMGLDTKRTDTPKPIQKFLTKILQLILSGKREPEVLAYISEFREEFRKWNPWDMGTPKGVRGIIEYTEKMQKTKGKVTVPGHVRASMNYNKLRELNNDNETIPINDGNKIVVCKLKKNALDITSIAYPVDEERLPDWFKACGFDTTAMEEGMIDKKLENLIGVLKWDLKSTKNDTNFNLLFVPKKKK